jgi:hypothetical protein
VASGGCVIKSIGGEPPRLQDQAVIRPLSDTLIDAVAEHAHTFLLHVAAEFMGELKHEFRVYTGYLDHQGLLFIVAEMT